MKNFILILSITLFLNKSFSQNDSINLPLGESQIKINSDHLILNVYLTKEGELYLEDNKINVSDLGPKIKYLSSKLPEYIDFKKKIFLNIDIDTPYKIVDQIKTQLAHNEIRFIYYKTASLEEEDILKAMPFFNYYSSIKFQPIEKILTESEIEESQRKLDSLEEYISKNGFDNIPAPPPPPAPPITSLTYLPKFYSDRQEVIDEVLKEKEVKCVQVSDEKLIIDGDNQVQLSNMDELKQYLNNLDFIVLYFKDDLGFENYFNLIEYLKRESLDLYKRKQHSFHIIEISKETEEIHEKAKVSICN